MTINNSDDVMDLLANSFGAPWLLVDEAELGPGFFDLSTGLAGELLQKFVNYNKPLAVVVKDRTRYSARFQELAREHDRHACIRFFPDQVSAAAWLQQH